MVPLSSTQMPLKLDTRQIPHVTHTLVSTWAALRESPDPRDPNTIVHPSVMHTRDPSALLTFQSAPRFLKVSYQLLKRRTQATPSPILNQGTPRLILGTQLMTVFSKFQTWSTQTTLLETH